MFIRKRITRSLGTLIILWSAAAFADQPLEVADDSGASDADAETVAVSKPVVSEGAGGRAEGIKVHGHWTIEIRDPDGTLVSRREFENALSVSGQSAITRILTRFIQPGRWTIAASGSPSPCGAPCVVAESTDPQTGTNIFKTLSVTQGGVGGIASIILSGNATASADGSITVVTTSNQTCGPATASCTGAPLGGAGGATFTEITRTTLTTAISVLNGQQIQLQVIIQFS